MTRRGDFTLKGSRFRLDIRGKVFSVRMAKHWHGLPREVVAVPFLEVSLAGLDRAWSI